eukprot:TRINITY_DN33550_c0_g1_i2.p1 TRINITY_DN33550_c0_g1~~TRINITY_DN33550_c0_g1_i2.p1  ORF type:complete len:2255 (+),score=496.52 TRINITY_DN33550_c0_g1_i2:124-6888(+)
MAAAVLPMEGRLSLQGAGGQSVAATCEELVEKLAPRRLAEVRDRALRALSLKVTNGVFSAQALARCRTLPYFLLHWIHDRQEAANVDLLRAALRLLTTCAQTPEPEARQAVEDAGCLEFLETYTQCAPAVVRADLEAAIAAMLVLQPGPPLPWHPPPPAQTAQPQTLPPSSGFPACAADSQAKKASTAGTCWQPQPPAAVFLGGGLAPPQGQATCQLGRGELESPVRSSGASGVLDSRTVPELAEADAQILMDLSVRLRFGDATVMLEACRDVLDLVADFSAADILSHRPLVDGLCRAIVGNEARVAGAPMLSGLRARGEPPLPAHVARHAALKVFHALLERYKEEHRHFVEAKPTSARQPTADAKWPVAAPALLSTFVLALRHGLGDVDDVESVTLTYGICLLLKELTTHGHGSASAFHALQDAGLLQCVKAAAECLCACLKLSTREVRSVEEAAKWFGSCTSRAAAALSAADSVSWGEVLYCQDWDFNRLAILDIWLELLSALKPSLYTKVAGESKELPQLAALLLSDYRLLFERPSIARGALKTFAAEVCEDAAQDCEVMFELLQAATPTPSRSSRSKPPWEEEGAAMDATATEQQLARVKDLERQLHLLKMVDSAMWGRHIVPDILALVSEVALRASELDLGPEQLGLEVALRASELDLGPEQLGLEDAVAALCCRLLAAPPATGSATLRAETAADLERIHGEFLAALENAPYTNWLFRRLDFLSSCLCHSGPAGVRLIASWRQGDCASRPPEGLEIDEYIEAACEDVLPSSPASTFRRLFSLDAKKREEAALAIFRAEIESMPSDGEASPMELKFAADPLGSILDGVPRVIEALDGFHVQKLTPIQEDLDHLLGVCGSNQRLGYNVRAAAFVQLATFLASAPAHCLPLLRDAARNLPLLLLDLVRSVRGVARGMDGPTPPADFYTRVCQTASILLLAGAELNAESTGGVRQQLLRHRESLLDALPLLVFHGSGCLRLRAAALQLAACLLFENNFTTSLEAGVERLLPEGSLRSPPSAARASSAGRLAIRLPAWVRRLYQLPLQTDADLATPPATVQYWQEKPMSVSATILCQLLHRLQQVYGLDLRDIAGCDGPAGGAWRSCGGGDIVWKRLEGRLIAASTPSEMLEVVEQIVLVPPVGRALLRHGYISRLFNAMGASLCVGGLGQTGSDGVGKWLGRAERDSRCEPHMRLLRHLLALVAALPASGDMSADDRRHLEALAEFFSRRLLPSACELASLRPMEEEDRPASEAASKDSQPEATLLAKQTAHGVLAGDDQVRAMIEASLRLSIALARRREMSINWLLTREWVMPLSFQVTSSVTSLRRLALSVSMYIMPHLLSQPPHSGPEEAMPQRPFGVMEAHISAFCSSVLAGLSSPAACTASMRHSFDLKAWLQLLCKAAPWLPGEVCDARAAAAAVLPWLSHKDVLVKALAWRALRTLRFHPARRRLERSCADEAADVAHGLRVLRLAAANGGADSEGNRSDEQSVNGMYAEIVEYIRLALEVAAANGDDERRNVYAKQLLEAGLLNGRFFSTALTGPSLGLRRTTIRLMQTLLAATGLQVEAKTRFVQEDAWACVIENLLVQGGGVGEAWSWTDAADLAADVIALLGHVAACDAQMFFWIGTSLQLAPAWQTAIRRLLTLSEDVCSWKRRLPLVSKHLIAIYQLLQSMEAYLTKRAAEGGENSGHRASSLDVLGLGQGLQPLAELLHSGEFANLLSEGLQERMPAGIQKAAASSVATLCGLRLVVSELDTSVQGGGPTDDVVARSACRLFMLFAAQPGGAGLEVMYAALQGLFNTSRLAADSACGCGFLAVLVQHASTLPAVAQPAVATTASALPAAANACSPQWRFVGALRTLAALLTSSPAGLLDAMEGRRAAKRTGRVRLSAANAESVSEAPLAVVLRSVRGLAEKDTVVFLELLELLLRCLRANTGSEDSLDGSAILQSVPSDDGSCMEAESLREESQVEESAVDKSCFVQAFLVQTEFVHWLMRQSQRQNIPAAVYCKIMKVLALCASLLSGKSVCLQFVGQVAQTLRVLTRSGGEKGSTLTPGAWSGEETWRMQRLTATLHFISSLRLCSRSVEILASPVPAAHGDVAGASGGRAVPGLGMDFWLDLAELEGRYPVSVRAGALMVLLAIATSRGPSSRTAGLQQLAKAHFTSSERAVTLLLRIARSRGAGAVADGIVLAPRTLSLSILWVLGHGQQRAVVLMRKLNAPEVIREASELVAQSDGPDREYALLTVRQLERLLC